MIRRALKGARFVAAQEAFEVTGSRAHGHVEAVRRALQRLGFAALIASQPSRERDLVCAMVAARVPDARTKLASTRWWQTTTLADDFGVAGVDVDEPYMAMDWLLHRQDMIERKLARIGYSRDGCKNTLLASCLASAKDGAYGENAGAILPEANCGNQRMCASSSGHT